MARTNPNSKPKTKRIHHADRLIEFHRDEFGVPHVHASSWLDALYGLGYMHAQDRGTQVLLRGQWLEVKVRNGLSTSRN